MAGLPLSQRNDGVAYRRHHRCPAGDPRLRQAEARRIDPIVGRRVVLLQFAQQHTQEMIRVVVVTER